MEVDYKLAVKNGIDSLMKGFNDTANDILQKHGISEDIDTLLKDANEAELIWFWSHLVPIRKDKEGNYYIGNYEYQ